MKTIILLLAFVSSLCWGQVNVGGARWGSWVAIETASTGGDTATANMGTVATKAGYVTNIVAGLNISHIGLKVASKTGTPAASSYMVSLQSVGADGLPTGNDIATGSAVSAGSGTATTFTPSATGWLWVAIGTPYTAARGDLVAVVVERVAATDASNKIEVAIRNATGGNLCGLPYALTNDGASWARAVGDTCWPLFGYKNSDASVVGGKPSSSTGTAQAFGNTVETGASFTLPASLCTTYTVRGVRWRGTTPAAGTNTFAARIYASPRSSPSALQSTTAQDGDTFSAAAASRANETYFSTAPLAELACGTEYVIALSTTTASNMDFLSMTVPAAADFNAHPYAQQMALASRTVAAYPPGTDATAFTITNTTRPALELIIETMTPPQGGSVGGVF